MMGFGLGSFGMILFWAVIIAVVVLIFKGTVNFSHKDHDRKRESALDILKRRYAQGEISREDFESKRRDIIGT